MNKEHTVLNCWCKTQADEEEKGAELAKDNKREGFLDGYKDLSCDCGRCVPPEAPF